MNARIPEQDAGSSTPAIESMLLQVTAGRDALPVGHRLDQFVVEGVIDRDDLCIRYSSRDPVSGDPVEIEEYLPETIARREDDGTVQPRSATLLAAYQAGMRAFLEEALQLANTVHPSLLRMLRSWDGQGAAYRARPVVAGHTLAEVRRTMTQPPDEAWLRSILHSLAGALRALHATWLVHGNVRPGNIVIRPDGAPLLLGFESARWTLADRLPHPEPGFIAIEQLEPSRGRQQGPWSDVYALGALVVYCATGRAPTPAPERAGAPLSAPFANALADMWRAGIQVSYSPALVAAVDAALAVSPGQRLRSIDEFLAALEAPPLDSAAAGPARPALPPPASRPAVEAALRPMPAVPAAASQDPASKAQSAQPPAAPARSNPAAVPPGQPSQGDHAAAASAQAEQVPVFFADIPARHPMPPPPSTEAVRSAAPAPAPAAAKPAVRLPVSLPVEPELHGPPPAPQASPFDPAVAGGDEPWRAVRPSAAAAPPVLPGRKVSSRAWWLVAALPLAALAALGWHWQQTWQTEQAISAYGQAGSAIGAQPGAQPASAPARSNAVDRADAALAAAAQNVAAPVPVVATRDGLPLPDERAGGKSGAVATATPDAKAPAGAAISAIAAPAAGPTGDTGQPPGAPAAATLELGPPTAGVVSPPAGVAPPPAGLVPPPAGVVPPPAGVAALPPAGAAPPPAGVAPMPAGVAPLPAPAAPVAAAPAAQPRPPSVAGVPAVTPGPRPRSEVRQAAGVPPPAQSTVKPAIPTTRSKAPAPADQRRTAEARRPTEAEPVSPRAACSPRTNFALYRCMQAQCERDVFYTHPQCIRLRQRDEVS